MGLSSTDQEKINSVCTNIYSKTGAIDLKSVQMLNPNLVRSILTGEDEMSGLDF